MTDTNSPDFWGSIYRAGSTGWDLGGPAPVFVDLLEKGLFAPGKMIVLGAGKGHDARLFARHGFDVTAVDFAEEAVQEMETLAEPVAPVNAVQADLFDLPETFSQTFDYVLEYVCYCAIDPSRRKSYAQVVADLLRPGGLFIGVIFPIEDRPGGPPFAVSVEELAGNLVRVGFELVSREAPSMSVGRRAGREELVVLQKGG